MRIAVCIDSYNIDYSPSIINFLDCLSDEYPVHLYLRNVPLRSSRVLAKETIDLFVITESFSMSSLVKGFKKSLKKAVRFLLFRKPVKTLKKEKRVTVERVSAAAGGAGYGRYICLDPHGFLLCMELFPRAEPVYYSLELFLKDDYLASYYPASVVEQLNRLMDRERSRIQSVSSLIIQSEEKAELFKTDYGFPPDLPTFILPVTYKGGAVAEKSRDLRELYRIPDDKYIAIHLGGMNDWFSCIEIAQVFARMPGWVLFFQGNHHTEYLKRFEQTPAIRDAGNIIVSNVFYDQLEDVDRLVMSADLGIAWYNDISKNFTTAGKSSGKITAYMRFGLPTVAKKYPSTVEAIQNPGCGLCVDRVDEIPGVVARIRADYDTFSKNARSEYEKTYRFEMYSKPLIEFIRGREVER